MKNGPCMYGRRYKKFQDMQIPPVFYRTLSPLWAEAVLTHKATFDESVSTRAPEPISCLWMTGYGLRSKSPLRFRPGDEDDDDDAVMKNMNFQWF